MENYRFYKEQDVRWYVDLPDWTGSKEDLEMVAGADTMLEIVAQGENEVSLTLSLTAVEGYDTLEFLNYGNIHGPELGEGAWYLMKSCKGIVYDLELWLCDVTKFVFGEFPEIIYVGY